MRNDGWKITGKLGFLKGQIEMVTENRIDQCIECCLYRDECDGKELFKLPPKIKGFQSKLCVNRVNSPNNTISPLQLRAFYSPYYAKIKGGESKLEAFVGAITQTLDDVFAESMKNNHRLVEKYVQQDDGKYPLTMKRVEQGLHPVNRSGWRAS